MPLGTLDTARDDNAVIGWNYPSSFLHYFKNYRASEVRDNPMSSTLLAGRLP